MNVVVTDYVEPDLDLETQEFRKVGIGFHFRQLRDAEAVDLGSAVRDADVIVVDQARLSQRVLELAVKCRLVIRHGDGYDNVDLGAATKLGIAVANKPGFWSTEVAEHALTSALALCRSIPVQKLRGLERTTSNDRKVDLSSLGLIRRISASVIGVIGFGKIGSRLAKMASGLFESVLVHDPYVLRSDIERVGAESVRLPQLLAGSDVISIHVPLNDETRKMLGNEAFGQMKRRPVVVNAARGGVVDTDELVVALQKGLISGAALDTTEPEPLPKGHPLTTRDDVLITPHLAWYSSQAMQAMRRSIISDVIAFAGGRVPKSVVNPDVFAAPNCRVAE